MVHVGVLVGQMKSEHVRIYCYSSLFRQQLLDFCTFIEMEGRHVYKNPWSVIIYWCEV